MVKVVWLLHKLCNYIFGLCTDDECTHKMSAMINTSKCALHLQWNSKLILISLPWPTDEYSCNKALIIEHPINFWKKNILALSFKASMKKSSSSHNHHDLHHHMIIIIMWSILSHCTDWNKINEITMLRSLLANNCIMFAIKRWSGLLFSVWSSVPLFMITAMHCRDFSITYFCRLKKFYKWWVGQIPVFQDVMNHSYNLLFPLTHKGKKEILPKINIWLM